MSYRWLWWSILAMFAAAAALYLLSSLLNDLSPYRPSVRARMVTAVREEGAGSPLGATTGHVAR